MTYMKIPKKHLPGMAVLTLWIFGEFFDDALEILGEDAGLYGDNGGFPNGDMLLPSQPLNDGEAVEEILKRGWGELIPAFYYDSEEEANEALRNRHLVTAEKMKPFCYDDEDLEDPNVFHELFLEAMEVNASQEKVYGWAYYGDSVVIAYADVVYRYYEQEG